MMELTDKHLKIIGKIVYIASDKRLRVSQVDQNEWLEEKLKEIKKISKQLPRISYPQEKLIIPKEGKGGEVKEEAEKMKNIC